MRFELTYRLLSDFTPPPFVGSLLRGSFGNVFRREVCVRRDGSCSICTLRSSCPYLYVFETPIPKGVKIMRKYTSAPHPFVIEPPQLSEDVLLKGREIKFGLVLIGRAIEYLPYFVYTFVRMGNIGIGRDKTRAKLVSVVNGGVELYDPDEKLLREGRDVRSVELVPEEGSERFRVKLYFPFPVSIKKDGNIARTIDFETLMRSFFRRLTLLEYFHNGGSGEYPFTDLLGRLSSVRSSDVDFHYRKIPRFSTRQKRRMFLEGVVGSVVYEDVPEVFMPYIMALEDLHVGKNTSFGLGMVKVEYERINR